MEPKNTVTKMDRPRARTQSGSAVCAETFREDSTAIQDAPASRLAAMAAAGTGTNATTASVTAMPQVPSMTTRSAPQALRIRGSRKAPSTAPRPTLPSIMPYSSAPPCSTVRTTSGNSAQNALANTKNATARTSVALSALLLRA
ncbi:hypothetical protein D9M69_544160 [compost metagenome]